MLGSSRPEPEDLFPGALVGLRLSHTTFDALDPYACAEFWRALLGWEPHDGYEPGSEEVYLRSPEGYVLLFVRVPDAKQVKNRGHLDLRPDEGSTRETELERALALGATLVEDRREGHLGWVVLADPEGNEFCILRRVPAGS